MTRLFYINARKLVQLEQVEIEADSEQEAAAKYLQMARKGEVAVDNFRWWALSEADLDIEDHGEVEAA